MPGTALEVSRPAQYITSVASTFYVYPGTTCIIRSATGIASAASSTSNYLWFNSDTQTTATTFATATTMLEGSWYVVRPSYQQYQPAPLSDEEIAKIKTLEIMRRARDVEKAKPSIKRALRLMANFGMEEDVRVFMAGGRIEVSHPDSLFKFVIEKGHSNLIERTLRPGHSTPYSLSLYTKSDVHVARLCVYLKDTPILDQILAISMFIKTGNEEEILRKANFFSLSDDVECRQILALEHPNLSNKLLMHDERRLLN